MGKIALFLFAFFLSVSGLLGSSKSGLPDAVLAHIEGLGYSDLMGPYVKENWPDLRTFSIVHVEADFVGSCSRSEAKVGPGVCTVTVEVKTRDRGSAKLELNFEAEAGIKYQLRPVYRGSAIHAAIRNMDTGEFVAQTWPVAKRHRQTDAQSSSVAEQE